MGEEGGANKVSGEQIFMLGPAANFSTILGICVCHVLAVDSLCALVGSNLDALIPTRGYATWIRVPFPLWLL